jgi:hypothetical protein
MLTRGAFRLRYMLSENDLAIIPPKSVTHSTGRSSSNA